jgi:hypothetical protein
MITLESQALIVGPSELDSVEHPLDILFDEETEREHRTSILLGQKTAPFAIIAMQEFDLSPRKAPQLYRDGKAIDPKTRTVAVGWHEVYASDGEPLEMAQPIGNYAYRLAAYSSLPNEDPNAKSYAELQASRKKKADAGRAAVAARAQISNLLESRGA